MITSQICSFCTQPLGELNHDHPCPHKLYSLTNVVTSAKQDSPTLLSNITNLVFQGGGVKGLAYLGALQQLQFEGQKEGRDFLSGIHRIAGTSAGSITALYLGLNLDVDNDIKPLMTRSYADLLDDGLILKVAVDLDSWWGIKNMIFDYKYKNFAVRDIILVAMKYFEDLEGRLNSGDQKIEAAAEKETEDLVETILKYYGTKVGTAYSLVIKAGASTFATDATKWLLKMLKPPPKPQDPENRPLKSSMMTSSLNSSVNSSMNSSRSYGSPRKPKPSKFENIVDFKCNKALIEANQAEVIDVHETPKLMSVSTMSASAYADTESVKRSSPSNAKGALRMGTRSMMATTAAATDTIVKPVSTHEKQVDSRKEDDASEYKLRGKKDGVKADPASDLTGKTLYNALGELLWFCIISQQNAAGVRQELGLFDGSVVKDQLIEGPIRKRLADLGLDPKENITFQELWDLNLKLPAEKRFKKFYVTSFNMEILRTEVFSVEHTPNVVIADAVRASMSIPVFFTPVTIREKTPEGLQERKSYSSDSADTVIHYMDGGILDNYPIWIFDDFRFCVQDIPEFKPPMRYSMQNPHTLGFRLLDKKIIDIYTNPYFDPERKRMKQINANKYEGTFSYQMGLLANVEVNQAQENEHIKRGDCARSVYVDNMGVSAVAFSLSDAEIDMLITSGANSVLNYKSRAALNGFVGEGQAYFS